MSLLKTLFGNYSKKELKRIQPICDKVLALEDKYAAMTDKELKAQTPLFRERFEKGESLDNILPEAFAVCREASWRVLGMKHFPVQIIGGIVLHQGRIAEMKTGEGKTLVATLPAYLNGLTGRGVHIVTVNDYLARRDSEWMGKLYRFLGLTVGLIVHDLDNDKRKAAYDADITYGTNNELGFDYLRDNMVVYKEKKVQREHVFAIVDEVDSILIDEARTPLIISGKGDKSSDLYERADKFAQTLTCHKFTEIDAKEDMEDYYKENKIDFIVDEKAKTATLTQLGVKKAEEYFQIENLTDPENLTIQHHINQAIKARGIMKRDIDYVVKDGEVIIVDEFTGRLMYGRRYNEGLHQAIEAKEGVKIESESKTLATITFQNFFRLYKKLSGMTGTAATEEAEFREIYMLDVVEIPTNKPLARKDLPDLVFRTETGKFNNVIEDIIKCHEKGQPVLVGTISIEKSEILSNMLKRRGIEHNVLNAKQHEREAEIVAQAGKFGAVTIATNMAGRGTDIMLGGNAEYMAKAKMRKQNIPEELIAEATGFADTDNEEILEARRIYKEYYDSFKDEIKEEAEKVRAAGGLYIMGTERHESRRIDNQLRGRSGRQGDPGESRFYISLEDDLLRLFGSEKLMSVFNTLGVEDGEQIEHKMLSSAIEKAQKKLEGNNFGIRKNLLEYDQVMNEQREIIYDERRRVLDGESMRDSIYHMITEYVENTVDACASPDTESDEWDLDALNRDLYASLLLKPVAFEEVKEMSQKELKQMLKEHAVKGYEAKEAEFPEPEQLREIERVVLLKVIDAKWMDHIDDMDQLRQGIGLQAYGQRDPLVEYKMVGYDMFGAMTSAIAADTVRMLFHVQLEQKVEREQVAKVTGTNKDDTAAHEPKKRQEKKVYPNDPCPCGSGKKYKQCCGRK